MTEAPTIQTKAAKPPTIRFQDSTHAISAGLSCDTAASGIEALLKNLERCTPVTGHADDWTGIAFQLTTGLQLVRNLKATFAHTLEAQIKEGSI